MRIALLDENNELSDEMFDLAFCNHVRVYTGSSLRRVDDPYDAYANMTGLPIKHILNVAKGVERPSQKILDLMGLEMVTATIKYRKKKSPY